MSVGIGFACVKHCARGFNLVMEGLEGLVRLFGRTGEQQLQMDVQLHHQQLCEYGATVKYMCVKEVLNRLIYPMIYDFKEDLILHHLDVQLQEQENCVMWLF